MRETGNRWSRWLAIAGLCTLPLAADAFPTQPIRLLVPFAAGGTNDLMARQLQRPLSKALGTEVVVENVPGGSTSIATGRLQRSSPDGHTLMLASHVVLMGIYYSGIYKTKVWNELTLLGETGRMPYALLEVKADSPYKTWRDIIDAARRAPGKLNAGGPASGGLMNLIVLQENKRNKVDMQYIPFNGGGPTLLAMLGGHVDFRVTQPPEALPNILAGKTRALAVSYSERMPELPDVPTFKEAGIPLEIPIFGFDVWGPPGMDAALARKISRAVETAIQDHEFSAWAKTQTYQTQYASPEDVRSRMQTIENSIGPLLLEAFPPQK